MITYRDPKNEWFDKFTCDADLIVDQLVRLDLKCNGKDDTTVLGNVVMCGDTFYQSRDRLKSRGKVGQFINDRVLSKTVQKNPEKIADVYVRMDHADDLKACGIKYSVIDNFYDLRLDRRDAITRVKNVHVFNS